MGTGGKARLVGWPLEGSAVSLAPPRTGKGATIALNYLAPGGRGWGGSTVLVDPRGETFCVVARRRREMGRRVVLLDPFGVVEGHRTGLEDELHLPDVRSARYNPMDFIRGDQSVASRDINVLLDALLTPPAGSNDTSSHFYESARAIIAGYIAWVRFGQRPDRRNFAEVYRLLTLAPDERKVLVAEMRKAEGMAGGMVRVAAERQMQVGEQEAGSNFSTIANQLSFLNYAQLGANTMVSDFDPMDLASGEVDLFAVVPEEMTEHARAWLRLWITIPNAVSGMKPLERDMLIIVDEMPKLGFLKPVMEGYNLAAGRGVHFWCFAQSISAWDATWGKDTGEGMPLGSKPITGPRYRPREMAEAAARERDEEAAADGEGASEAGAADGAASTGRAPGGAVLPAGAEVERPGLPEGPGHGQAVVVRLDQAGQALLRNFMDVQSSAVVQWTDAIAREVKELKESVPRFATGDVKLLAAEVGKLAEYLRVEQADETRRREASEASESRWTRALRVAAVAAVVGAFAAGAGLQARWPVLEDGTNGWKDIVWQRHGIAIAECIKRASGRDRGEVCSVSATIR